MANWEDTEVRELLAVRGEEEIKKQITDTVKDATIYGNFANILSDWEIKRSQQQVINKLEALRKQYSKVRDHNKNKSGNGHMEWPYYDLCNVVFGNSALSKPIHLSSASCANNNAPPKSSCAGSPSSQMVAEETADNSQHDSSINEDLGSRIEEAVDQTDTQSLHSNLYTAPPTKKKNKPLKQCLPYGWSS